MRLLPRAACRSISWAEDVSGSGALSSGESSGSERGGGVVASLQSIDQRSRAALANLLNMGTLAEEGAGDEDLGPGPASRSAASPDDRPWRSDPPAAAAVPEADDSGEVAAALLLAPPAKQQQQGQPQEQQQQAAEQPPNT